MKKIAQVNIVARDYNNQDDVMLAQKAQEVVSYTLDKTGVPLIYETMQGLCSSCSGGCQYCRVPRFAEELGLKMVKKYMDSLKGGSE